MATNDTFGVKWRSSSSHTELPPNVCVCASVPVLRQAGCVCVAVTAKLFVQHACRTSINPTTATSSSTSTATATSTYTAKHSYKARQTEPSRLAIKAAELRFGSRAHSYIYRGIKHTHTHTRVQVAPIVMVLFSTHSSLCLFCGPLIVLSIATINQSELLSAIWTLLRIICTAKPRYIEHFNKYPRPLIK